MSLKEYRRKRDFTKTAEPKGKPAKSDTCRFVIQKHAASHLHYDFRLELDGTLKSWAVPKGIPFAKGEKRLAIQVEDHPVSYIDFEGTIPKGQYGGGTVMVWDRGTFEPLSDFPGKELAAGKLHFVLSGKKLHGEWYLVQLRHSTQWLLIRGKGDMRPISKKLDDTSALSGKSIKQLANAKAGRVWNSNKSAQAIENSSTTSNPTIKSRPAKTNRAGANTASLKPHFIEPMKARLINAPPVGDWIYEIKLDGFRALAVKDGETTRLFSRNEKDFGTKFPDILEAIKAVRAESAIIDGEIVALDPKGRSSFQLLQAYELGEQRPPLFYYAFDLLQLNGRDLQKEPLTSRKEHLEKLLKNAPVELRYSASLDGSPTQLLKQAAKLGLEGLIGKQKNSLYEAGRRSGAWIKLKLLQQQELVIGGYTDPTGSRQHFGALLVGYNDKGGLHFAGKVGTGFDDAMLRELHHQFNSIESPRCPFVNLPEKRTTGRGQGLTASAMRHCHWLKPKLVAQIKFAEWTRDGKLRQPVFLGLRDDKSPRDVVRETAA